MRADQAALDARLIELDGTPSKSRLGANAMLAVSMAAAHAAAAAAGEPLYRYLGGPDAHAAAAAADPDLRRRRACRTARGHPGFHGRLPRRARASPQALDWTAEVYRAAGALMAEAGTLARRGRRRRLVAGVRHQRAGAGDAGARDRARRLHAGRARSRIALDVAASEFGRGGKYKLALEDKELDSEGMIELLTGWISALSDRVDRGSAGRGRRRGVRRVHPRGGRARAGRRRRFPGHARPRGCAKPALRGAANAVLLKPNQRGTLTETLDAWTAAQEAGFAGIVSARSGETEDVTIVHLAVGWGVGQLKVGSFARGERMAKWNEALRIEEALGAARALRRRRGAGTSRRARVKVRLPLPPPGPRLWRPGSRRSVPSLTCTSPSAPKTTTRCLRRLLPRRDVLWHVLQALHSRDDRRGAAAAADPEDRRRRQHDRSGCGEGARHPGVQPARHQCARGGGTDAGADAGRAAPAAALRCGDCGAASGSIRRCRTASANSAAAPSGWWATARCRACSRRC